MKKEFKFSLELLEDNALVISLLSRFADVERIADHATNIAGYVVSESRKPLPALDEE